MSGLNGRVYHFDLLIEITDALAFSSGEFAAHLAEAIFELDHLNLLFPGLNVPEPGERVLAVSLQQTGYGRRASMPSAASLPAASPPASAEQQDLLSSLEDAGMRVGDMMRDLRLIKAKAEALVERLTANTAWTKPQTKIATDMVAAIEALLESHATHIAPQL